ncbi:MAG TPA: hemolysin family protein [Candidatus Limnocylindrales bacterium]|nr:hemolysin family protein [Candidatus Limnocylindrales bacterium]
MGSSLLEIVVIALLVLVNGVFVAAEIALVTVRRSRIRQLSEEGDARARRVGRMTEHPSRLLATIQLGITFVGFLAAAFAGASLAGHLADGLRSLSPLRASADVLALLIVTLIVSLVTIVFGELVPKTLALAHAERYALALARPVELLGTMLAPVVWSLTTITHGVTRLLGVSGVSDEAISSEELRILVERGGEQGTIEAEEEQMIGGVLELGERRVHEVMVARVDIAALSVDASLGEIIETIVAEGHSRIPVYDGSMDNIVGLLYAKDLLPYLVGDDRPPSIRGLLRTPLFVPESMLVDDLLHSLQRRRVHIAIVLDEHGGTAGLVSIEDLIEEIVGEIQDEYDEEEPMIVPLGDAEARVDGRADVDDLLKHFDSRLEGDDQEQFDTVGGLVYHYIGGVPRIGDAVDVDGLRITVEETDGRRVRTVHVARLAAPDDEADPGGG